jgi:hypothetical protein
MIIVKERGDCPDTTIWAEGYFANKEHPEYQTVTEGVDYPEKKVILEMLDVAEGKAKNIGYLGWSTCRVCRCHNGSREFVFSPSSTDWSAGEYRWPEGLKHYIEKHSYKPSDVFIKLLRYMVTIPKNQF